MPERGLTSCAYRIYPSWFGGDSMAKPMEELAKHAAAQMGRQDWKIRMIGHGEDARGQFIDFRVTYASTGASIWITL
jgi:hypothetical protein